MFNSAREDSLSTGARQRGGLGEWIWVIAAVGLVTFTITVSLGAALVLRAANELSAAEETQTIHLAALPTPVDARTNSSSSGASFLAASGQLPNRLTLEDGQTVELTPWNGTSRITILIMGLDRRPYETGLGFRTDTMLLVSLDPTTNSLGILSIPRDLYIEVVGYSQLQRINTAMVLGELQRAGYGPQLAMQTVEYNLGIRVQHYAVVDFEAFITLVDSIGGITLDVPYEIYDAYYPDMYNGFDPFYIAAGVQRVDGATALRYARTRHNDSDFERARRQQQVMFAIRDQVLSLEQLPALIAQSPTLLRSLSNDVYTSLSLEEMIRLGLTLRDIPEENIHTGVIDYNYIIDYTTEDGAQVLIPQREALGYLMADVFGANYWQ